MEWAKPSRCVELVLEVLTTSEFKATGIIQVVWDVNLGDFSKRAIWAWYETVKSTRRRCVSQLCERFGTGRGITLFIRISSFYERQSFQDEQGPKAS
jgi:hypothetical protein